METPTPSWCREHTHVSGKFLFERVKGHQDILDTFTSLTPPLFVYLSSDLGAGSGCSHGRSGRKPSRGGRRSKEGNGRSHSLSNP